MTRGGGRAPVGEQMAWESALGGGLPGTSGAVSQAWRPGTAVHGMDLGGVCAGSDPWLGGMELQQGGPSSNEWGLGIEGVVRGSTAVSPALAMLVFSSHLQHDAYTCAVLCCVVRIPGSLSSAPELPLPRCIRPLPLPPPTLAMHHVLPLALTRRRCPRLLQGAAALCSRLSCLQAWASCQLAGQQRQ